MIKVFFQFWKVLVFYNNLTITNKIRREQSVFSRSGKGHIRNTSEPFLWRTKSLRESERGLNIGPKPLTLEKTYVTHHWWLIISHEYDSCSGSQNINWMFNKISFLTLMKMFFIKLTFFAVYGLIRRRRFDLSDDDPRELNMVVELVEFMRFRSLVLAIVGSIQKRGERLSTLESHDGLTDGYRSEKEKKKIILHYFQSLTQGKRTGKRRRTEETRKHQRKNHRIEKKVCCIILIRDDHVKT